MPLPFLFTVIVIWYMFIYYRVISIIYMRILPIQLCLSSLS